MALIKFVFEQVTTLRQFSEVGNLRIVICTGAFCCRQSRCRFCCRILTSSRFYRAMHMYSAVYAMAVCLSVRRSNPGIVNCELWDLESETTRCKTRWSCLEWCFP